MNKEQELAFPFISNGACQDHQVCEGGMTLRDYFAAKAMQGIVSSAPWEEALDFGMTAETAYRVADAMLKTRRKHDEQAKN
jgi:hypothetical protein